jgi:signal transduction histidine kinase
MSFWQQLIQLLSESPSSIVYHLVTLLALQAVLGIALWQWRRDPSDNFARRLSLAAAGILLARFAIMFAALISSNTTAVGILPPLEQAVNAITAVLLVWALTRHMPHLPRLGDVVLVMMLIFIGVMYAFFAQNWWTAVNAGNITAGYNSSPQATVWGIFQLAILAIGVVLVVGGRPRDWGLRSFTLALLFIAHLGHFWNYPEFVATNTDIAYWVRLGNLMAFPLLAVLAYRHNLAELLAAHIASRPPAEQLAQFLSLSRRVIDSLDINRTLQQATAMVNDVIKADMVALATVSLTDPTQLRLTSSQAQEGKAQPKSWALNQSDWPSFRMAMQQRQGIELTPNGLGARQLRDFYQEIGVNNLGALLIEPLIVANSELGVLLLGAPAGQDHWPVSDRALLPYLAAYVAQAVHNAQSYEKALHANSPPATSQIAVDSGRFITLEKQRDEAAVEARSLSNRLEQARLLLFNEQQKTRDLSNSLARLEQVGSNGDIIALEHEIETLREALIEAEEAMALASAGEAGLSPEWVVLTITRYSGELEEAQARIAQLEEAWHRHEAGQKSEILVSLAQELRTPLTSIGAYADLLLSQTMGILNGKQVSVLHRIEANVDHTETLLEQIVQVVMTTEKGEESAPIDVRETIETAVTNGLLQQAIPQFRQKELRLALYLAEEVAAAPIDRDAFYQILLRLLRYACEAANPNGRISLSARADRLEERRPDGATIEFNYLHLAVSDSGSTLSLEERLNLLADGSGQEQFPVWPPGASDSETQRLVQNIGHSNGHSNGPDKAAAAPISSGNLATARSLVTAHGGRIWIDSQEGVGSVITVLLPLLAAEVAPVAAAATSVSANE